MIRALLLGAFATSAFGAECGKDISAVACRGFASNADFNVANDVNVASDVKITGNMEVNAATTYIGAGPWKREEALLTGQPNGCAFSDTSPNGDFTTEVRTDSTGWLCNSGVAVLCAGSVPNQEKAIRTFEIGTNLQAMVQSLDEAGRFAVYFQRVLANPFAATASLKWIAENACKVYVDVEFECTGGNCVEVTTIVCASFAGIKADNSGNVAIECKVPIGFGISKQNPNNGGTIVPGASLNDLAGAVSGGLVLEAVWDGANPAIIGNMVFGSSPGSSTGTLTGEVTTVATLGQSQGISGNIEVRAFVCQGTCNSYTAGEWTISAQVLHEAKYNLTRASNQARTFNMDVNVLFYSDGLTAVKGYNDMAGLFTDAEIQRPFLAKTEVEYGDITSHNNAYLSVIAKVATNGTPEFKDLNVNKVSHTVQGGSPVVVTSGVGATYDQLSGFFCTQMTAATTYATSAKWPQAYMSCPGLMMTGADGSTEVKAGDTLTLGVGWKLVNPNVASNGAGKAALLQDAADEVQSVEVSLTIQLGGGETTITTAGGSDGSADPTVTYIIIAVCIVAAGLILAVVVVAFMCMRNRSQEAIVSMSPQKCTVAAVYDISQPKKADAMDV